MEITPGMRLLIEAPGRGACYGRVEQLTTPAALPDLPDLPAEAARAVLAEWHVQRVALISYHAAPGAEFAFTALQIAGHWFDLQRQPLTLTPRE